MKILPCERRDSCWFDFSRLRSSQLDSIELPLHMIPAIRWAHRNTMSSNSLRRTPREYRQAGYCGAMLRRALLIAIAACGSDKSEPPKPEAKPAPPPAVDAAPQPPPKPAGLPADDS